MRYIAVFLLFFVSLIYNVTAIAQEKPVKTIIVRGSDSYPPFEFLNDKGEPDGFNVDLFRAVMKTLDMSYDLKLGKWDEVIDSMYNGKIDALVGMIYSEERARNVRFCLPHCEVNRNIISRNKDKLTTVESLRGKEIIVQAGGWSDSYVKKNNLTDKVILVGDMSEALSLLESGKYDAAIGSNLVAMYNIKSNRFKNLIISDMGIESQRYSIVVNHDDEMLLRLLNIGLQELKANGEYDILYNKWFGVYNGLSKMSKIIYYSLGVLCLLVVLSFVLVYILRQRVRKATLSLDILNKDLQLSLKAGEVSAWRYDLDRGIIESLHGDTIAKDGILLDDLLTSFKPEDAKIFMNHINSMISGEESVASVIIDYLNDDNVYKSYQSEMIVEKDKKSQVKFIIGTQKDITLQRQLEIERQEVILALKIAVKQTSLFVLYYDVDSSYFFKLDNDKFVKTNMTHDSVFDLIHPDDRVASERIFNGLLSGDIDSEDIIIRSLNPDTGEYSYLELYLCSVRNNNGDVFRIALNQRDITQKCIKRLQIESAYKSLDMAMEAAELVVWEHNIATDKYTVLYGDKDGTHGKQSEVEKLNRIHKDDLEMFNECRSKVFNGESDKETITVRLMKNNGGYGYFESTISSIRNADGLILNMIGSLKDVTKRKQTELFMLKNQMQLELANKKNELILNNTNSGLAYIRNDYVVEWENVSICSASLSHEAYKKGEKCYKSAHGRSEPCDKCVLKLVNETKRVERIEFDLANGNIIEIFGTPVFDPDGNVSGIVIRIDDITKRVQMYKDLAEAKEKAEKSDKLKSAFLANMSHEIRTPLNAIIGFSDLIVSSDDKEEKEEFARIVNLNSDLLLRLINDILELSKIEAGFIGLDLVDVDLHSCFNDIAKMMTPRVRKGVEFICENPYQSCIISADRDKLTQVITNFLTNATKFTTSGHIKMKYELVEGGVCFSVSDTGIGIAKENISKVFTRFEKLDDFAQGTGLGMTICKAIIESMGGEIGVESELGEGSTFWAFIPCNPVIKYYMEGDKEPMDNKTDEVSDIIVQNRPKRKVLVVEDDKNNFDLVYSILRDDFEVVHAKNGEVAVDAMLKSKFDVVLMDMRMPLMNGLDATAKIREFDSVTPIIALTAHAFSQDMVAALEAGCSDYLTKPIKKDILMAMLNKVLRNTKDGVE